MFLFISITICLLNHYYSKEISNYLKAFYTIEQTTILPFLFRVFNDYENDSIGEETLCKVLDYLLTYLVRITLIFLNDLRANDRISTDKEFEEALIHKPLYKKPICKFVLSVIENSTKEHIDISNLTIEHILLRKENAAVWKKEVGEEYMRYIYIRPVI